MSNILNSLSKVNQGDVVLSVRDIKKTFIEGGQPLHILRGGGFDLHRGEIIALVGQSGSGKSTLLQCVGLLDKPSAGSSFKRPVGYFAAALIEECGLKGCTVGGAQVSEKHAGFVINTGGATASDVKRVIEAVSEKVFLETSVKLEPEVEFIGR